jgi:hypothetical protein
MILLAGLLLVMSYLVFSTQTALLATVGQEAGREATNPVFSDYLGIRTGFAEFLKQELTDSAGLVQCPSLETNWKGRVETIMTMISQLESNRGQTFHGSFTDATITATEVTTIVEFYISDGDSLITEEVKFVTACV